jgi:hypothetical protein
VPIKKKVQEFIIACEHRCKLFSKGEPLTCHEAEILNCCMDEFAKWRLVGLAGPQAPSKKGPRET